MSRRDPSKMIDVELAREIRDTVRKMTEISNYLDRLNLEAHGRELPYSMIVEVADVERQEQVNTP